MAQPVLFAALFLQAARTWSGGTHSRNGGRSNMKRSFWILLLAFCLGGSSATNAAGRRTIHLPGADGEKRLCWFEAKSDDALIRKYILGQLLNAKVEYVLRRFGSKMPASPGVELKTGPREPAEGIPCWRVAASATVDKMLWVALAPIPRPRVVYWIGMPPHPHSEMSGGPPYEGGILRVDLATLTVERWTSANGLPPELVCPNADSFPDALRFGAIVTGIGEERGHIAFTTRSQSKVLFDPARKTWTAVRCGEVKPLIGLLTKDSCTAYAIERLSQLRSKEAVPALIKILARAPAPAGRDFRFRARQALLAINDKSALPGLRKLVNAKHLRTRQYARFIIQEMETPFGEPVNGLRFHITTPDNPRPGGWQINVHVSVMNTTDSEIALCYVYGRSISRHIALAMEPAPEGFPARKPSRYPTRHTIIKPGGVARFYHYLDPDHLKTKTFAVGTYRITCRINVPAEFAAKMKRQRGAGSPDVWHGSVTTNTVAVHVIKSAG